MSQLDIEVTNVFDRSWISTARIIVHRGATRSSKTYSVCQQLAIWLFTGYIREHQYIPKGKASVVRKHQTTLRKTVEADFLAVLDEMGMIGKVAHNKTNREYVYGKRMVCFIGADDEQKVRGFKSNILYANEANELIYDKEYFQLMIRTEDLVILDLNPSDPYTWVNERIEQERATQEGDVEVIVSTFRDNPYLPIQQRKEIERLERTDPQLWQVYGLGQYGIVDGLIFPAFTIVDEMPTHLAQRGYGLDFGYSIDPAVVIEAGVQNKRDLYLDEIIYGLEMTNADLADEMKLAGMNQRLPIWCDAAEPKSIEELRRLRWPAKKADKGADSIRYGINILKQYNLHVTKRSTNLIRALRRYKWAVDSQGRATGKPVGLDDDPIDAVRYYAVMSLNRPQIRMI